MGAFGTIIGSIMFMGGIFLSIEATFVITNNYLVFLLYLLFGLLGGLALGALNGRKARTQEKYKNEYTAYAAMAFAAIVFLTIYYFILGMSSVTAKNPGDFTDEMVVLIAAAGGLLTEFGLGLVVANSLAENSGY